jgi:cobalamin biosynthesis protein CbiG
LDITIAVAPAYIAPFLACNITTTTDDHYCNLREICKQRGLMPTRLQRSCVGPAAGRTGHVG